MSEVHPSAVVYDGAIIGEGTTIGPFCVIGPRVVLGKGNQIRSNVVIEGNTQIGDENVIYQFASVGADPQDLKFHGEDSRLEIGDKNIIREYATLQPGTEGGGMITTVGSQNLFMASTHVGHDCIIGEQNIFANCAALSGHVTIGNCCTLGGLSAIHQFVRLGDFCFISGGAMVVKDIPPYCTAQGDRAGLAGLNTIGLQRRGFSDEEISDVKKLYRYIFSKEGTLADRVEKAKEDYKDSEKSLAFIEFIATSERGVTIPRG